MAKKKDDDWRSHIEPLIPEPKRERREQLRVERAVGDAIRTGQRTGLVDTKTDAGLAALARELGRAVDVASSIKKDPYGTAAVSRELREVLSKLGLTPAARNLGATDAAAAFLESLANPSAPDQPTPPDPT